VPLPCRCALLNQVASILGQEGPYFITHTASKLRHPVAGMLPLDNLPGECRTELPTYLECDALAVDAGGFRSDRSGRHLSSPNFGTANAAEGVQAASFSGATEPAKWTLWQIRAVAWNYLKRSGRNCQGYSKSRFRAQRGWQIAGGWWCRRLPRAQQLSTCERISAPTCDRTQMNLDLENAQIEEIGRATGEF
jgi:hypothetical protein